jgi:hypothetical protein
MSSKFLGSHSGRCSNDGPMLGFILRHFVYSNATEEYNASIFTLNHWQLDHVIHRLTTDGLI